MSPQFEALEQRLLRALDQGLGDTRHTMREELSAIAAKVETIMLQGRDVTSSLAMLHADVADLKPRVAALEESDKAEHAVAEALEKNRQQALANKRQIRTWGITIVGIMLGFLTPITVAILTHLH